MWEELGLCTCIASLSNALFPAMLSSWEGNDMREGSRWGPWWYQNLPIFTGRVKWVDAAWETFRHLRLGWLAGRVASGTVTFLGTVQYFGVVFSAMHGGLRGSVRRGASGGRVSYGTARPVAKGDVTRETRAASKGINRVCRGWGMAFPVFRSSTGGWRRFSYMVAILDDWGRELSYR